MHSDAWLVQHEEQRLSREQPKKSLIQQRGELDDTPRSPTDLRVASRGLLHEIARHVCSVPSVVARF